MIFSSKETRDDLAEGIHSFILDAISRNNNSTENLEIEAKFGLILDKGTNSRIELPVMSECMINHAGWTNFVSDMPQELHKTFNEALNKRFANRELGWKYSHTRTVDYILPGKTRITLDSASGEIIHAQMKQNVNNLAIFQPKCAMDVRLSVNIEHPVDVESVRHEVSNPMACKRKKDRVSYEVGQGLMSIDLTQVMQNEGNGNQIKHELELEVKNPDVLLKSPEAFRAFVDAIRDLCRLIK